MIKIKKTMPAPGEINCPDDYRKNPVFDTICDDFHGKCYICGDKITSMNVEHIVPHKNKKSIQFTWENLFLACPHCNSTKLALKEFDNIINCIDDDPEEIIDFIMNPYPKTEPTFALKQADSGKKAQGEQTIKLLEKVFCQSNITAAIKSREAIELCNRLSSDILKFINKISEYYNASDKNKRECYIYVTNELGADSPFVAFKRAIARRVYGDKFEF